MKLKFQTLVCLFIFAGIFSHCTQKEMRKLPAIAGDVDPNIPQQIEPASILKFDSSRANQFFQHFPCWKISKLIGMIFTAIVITLLHGRIHPGLPKPHKTSTTASITSPMTAWMTASTTGQSLTIFTMTLLHCPEKTEKTVFIF